jgi:hypothetical protein
MSARAVFGVSCALAIAALGAAELAGAAPTKSASAAAGVVVVELFTSEGCSSCPPADAVLAELEAKQPVPGALIVPLAFHVDYWDETGWKDPFSSHAWTKRQLGYRHDGSGSLYTPQLVVDGRAEVNGGDRSSVQRAVADAATAPKTSVVLTMKPAAAGRPPSIVARVGALRSNADAGGADVMLAVVEPRARVEVTSGENAGRTLSHTSVVRSLVTLGHAQPGGTTLERALPPEVAAMAAARAVVFVQERGSHAIVGAAAAAVR